MNEETVNMEIRKFLKKMGITSQREIEKALQQAVNSGRLKGNEHIHVVARLEIADLDLKHVVEGELALE